MSTNGKIITWVVVAVVVVGGGIWWYASMTSTANAPAAYVNNPAPATTPTTPPTTPSSTGNTNNDGISATDTSNAALQGDLTAVDSQTSGFSSDNASITQGMNDQETQQSQIQ